MPIYTPPNYDNEIANLKKEVADLRELVLKLSDQTHKRETAAMPVDESLPPGSLISEAAPLTIDMRRLAKLVDGWNQVSIHINQPRWAIDGSLSPAELVLTLHGTRWRKDITESLYGGIGTDQAQEAIVYAISRAVERAVGVSCL